MSKQTINKNEYRNDEKNNKVIKIIIGAILLILIVLLFLFLCFKGSNSSGNIRPDIDGPSTDSGDVEEEGNNLTVTFNTDGGTNIDSIEVKKGGMIVTPVNPQKSGYGFYYWEYNEQIFDFSTKVHDDVELTAIWVEYTKGLNYELNNGEYSVSFSGESEGILCIPSAYNDLPVTTISEYGFALSGYEVVIIPETITSIETCAFLYSSSLRNVIISESVVSIEAGAFSYCESLKSITVNSYNDSYVTIDGNLYDKEVTKLVTVMNSIESIIIPESVTSIEEYAFFGSLLSSIIIPKNVDVINNHAFLNCESLTSVSFEEKSELVYVGEYAFDGCKSLVSIIIPDGLSNIGEYAFRNCSSLKSIIIPSSVTRIEAYTFVGCSSLIIYTTLVEEQDDWSSLWNYQNNKVYWEGQWEYNNDGDPTPIM